MRATKRRAGKTTFAALAIIATSAALIPAGEAQAAPGPRFGENYLLPPVSPGRARDVPGLAVNPANQNHIVEAEGDPFNLQCDYNASFDGGRTWTGGHLTVKKGNESPPFPTPACNQNFDSGGYHHFNTGIVFGSGQNVYITFSVHRGAFNRPESGEGGGEGDEAVVARSTDGGRTFEPAVVAVPGGGPVSASPNLAGFGMRPGLAVQRGAGTGGKDRLYVASWNCFTNGGCSGGALFPRRIYVVRSDDGGATWNTPVLASQPNVRTLPADITTAGTPDEQAREPSQPVVGPDGAIYVTYRNRDVTDGTSSCPANPANSNQKRNCIVIARSTNQGQSWQQFSTGVPICGGAGHPRLAIDPTGGTLYVAYQTPAACPNTADSDVVLQRSTTAGQTWSAPVTLNTGAAAGTAQTNPWPAVGPSGRVDVTWRDSRHVYPGSTMADIYYASSTNNGTSFGPSRRMTDRSINTGTGRMGDYGTYTWYGPVSLPLADGSVLNAWPDSRSGNFDTGFQDIYLARLDPDDAIARSSIATATSPGLSVRLSRLAYPGGSEAIGGDPVTRIVVASENDPAGALAGSVLARANWGPLLLSPAGSLPGIVKAESARLRPEGAFVIGNRSLLSNAVSDAVTDTTRDGENVSRVTVPDSVAIRDRPADIARRIAELMRPLTGALPEAVIVNPKTPDVPAAAAALAAALRLPILFVDERTTIPPPTNTAITSLGIKKLLIVGGTGSVNAAVETALGTAVGDPAMVKRLSGTNASDTSEAVLAEARLRGLPANVVYAADGTRPVEGAVLGAAVGRLNGLMLFTPGASTSAAEARVGALGGGLDAAVDRIVGAIGTGGSDPVVPAGPPRTPVGAGYPLPPANLQLPGCPGSVSSKNLIVLTNGNDTRNGTARPDLIFAGDGNDVVDSLQGDDCVDLGPGTDRGQGGSGDDFIQGGLGNDTVGGGTGKDRLRGFLGNDRLRGNSGDDLIVGGIGRDRITGASGNDSLRGESGNDRIAGGSGRDAINGGSGADTLQGNGGNDRITGGSGGDRISGSSGVDRISAFDGVRDRINCGSGRDRVTADRIDRVARNCERVRRR